MKRVSQLATAWANFDDQLMVHRTDEHEIARLGLTLTAVGVSPSLLATMHAEPDSMAATIVDVRAAVPALKRTASIDDVSTAITAFERLQTVTVAHLDHEEPSSIPLEPMQDGGGLLA